MRAFAIASLAVVGFAVWGPASAQVYWGDRGGWGGNRSGGWGWDDRRSGGWSWGDQHRHRDFFFPFFGDHYSRQAPAADYSPRRRANWTRRRATRSSLSGIRLPTGSATVWMNSTLTTQKSASSER
jgi:hypothetical protein